MPLLKAVLGLIEAPLYFTIHAVSAWSPRAGADAGDDLLAMVLPRDEHPWPDHGAH
jgi:hypothetical protein